MEVKLSTLQIKAIEKILSNFNGPFLDGKYSCNTLLKLDVGIGKTRIAVQTINKLVSNEGFALVIAPNKELLKNIWKKELDLILPDEYAFITSENLETYFLPSKKIFFPYDRKKVYLTTNKIISTECKTNDNTSPSSNSIASYIANTKGLKLTVFDEFHHISNGSELLQNAAKKLNSHLMLAMSATVMRRQRIDSAIDDVRLRLLCNWRCDGSAEQFRRADGWLCFGTYMLHYLLHQKHSRVKDKDFCVTLHYPTLPDSPRSCCLESDSDGGRPSHPNRMLHLCLASDGNIVDKHREGFLHRERQETPSIHCGIRRIAVPCLRLCPFMEQVYITHSSCLDIHNDNLLCSSAASLYRHP